MQGNKILEPSALASGDLLAAADSAGPAVTIMMPVAQGGVQLRENAVRLKQAIQSSRKALEELGLQHADIRELLEPVSGLTALFEGGNQAGGAGLVILRNRDSFRYSWTREAVPEKTVAGARFNLRPLIPELTQDRSFYLLALSKKHVRLLRCTDRSSEEVPLPPGTPTDLKGFGRSAQPDHVLDNRSTAGPSAGSSKGVMFGTSTDAEAEDERLAHFYRTIDKGLEDMLRESRKPLVIAGVEYEIPVFKRVTTCKNLAGAVIGAPDGLEGGEMHRRALEVMVEYWQRPVEEALAEFDKLYGAGRATANVKEVVTAAFDGRVSHLLAARSSEVMGEFHEATHQVSIHKQPVAGEEDLVNAAALWTLRNSGQVLITSRKKIPKGSHMAALLRY